MHVNKTGTILDQSIVLPDTFLAHMAIAAERVRELKAVGKLPQRYEDYVVAMFKAMPTQADSVHHAATGMAGEFGEVLDVSKKTWVYGKPLDVHKLVEEMGDGLFYIIAQLEMLGLTIEDLIIFNLEKLSRRYPEGYTDDAAIARVDKVVEGGKELDQLDPERRDGPRSVPVMRPAGHIDQAKRERKYLGRPAPARPNE